MVRHFVFFCLASLCLGSASWAQTEDEANQEMLKRLQKATEVSLSIEFKGNTFGTYSCGTVTGLMVDSLSLTLNYDKTISLSLKRYVEPNPYNKALEPVFPWTFDLSNAKIYLSDLQTNRGPQRLFIVKSGEGQSLNDYLVCHKE